MGREVLVNLGEMMLRLNYNVRLKIISFHLDVNRLARVPVLLYRNEHLEEVI